MQSGDTVGGGGAPALLHAFNCSTANSGATADSSLGDDWLIVTEIPASEFGRGTLVALCGFVGSIVKPERKIVVICPGDTRMFVGFAYPAPTKVVPWPKSGARPIKMTQLRIGRYRRMNSSLMAADFQADVEKGSATQGHCTP
jgi:hypothetical protein